MDQKHDEHAHMWRVQGLDNILLFKARFRNFAYIKHTHPEFAIGVVEDGIPSCYYKGGTHIVPPGTIITVNPDEIHTGGSTANTGYNYRMAYISVKIIRELLHSLYGNTRKTAYFPHIVTRDPALYRRLLRAFRLLDQSSPDLLQAQIMFFQIMTDLFYKYGQPHYTPCPLPSSPACIRRAREFIHAMAPSNISLNEMANSAEMSRFHFLRLFKAATGFSPYVYLLQQRVEIAKILIKDGHPIVQAALEAGFADQSHLTRRFKAIYGVTPGQYRQALKKK